MCDDSDFRFLAVQSVQRYFSLSWISLDLDWNNSARDCAVSGAEVQPPLCLCLYLIS